jgi:hypothetical protein
MAQVPIDVSGQLPNDVPKVINEEEEEDDEQEEHVTPPPAAKKTKEKETRKVLTFIAIVVR